MRGRKPLPTAIKQMNGNPGKRPLNLQEPQPDAAIPSAPDHLDDLALVEWERVSTALYEIGILAHVDRAILANYCIAWSRGAQAELQLKNMGLVLQGMEGGYYQNPWLAVCNKAMEQVHKYAAELGMTPSARTRIKANPAESKNQSAIMSFVTTNG